MSKRRTFSDYEKKTVYALGNGRCALCGKPIRFADFTIDHKVPLSKGGTNDFDNLQPACYKCNNMKSDMTTQELLGAAWRVLVYNKIGLCLTK